MADNPEIMRVQEADAAQIAQVLAGDHACIYYVDMHSGDYVEYSSTPPYRYLGIPRAGADFFGESRCNVAGVVHPDDVDALRLQLDRDSMLASVRRDGMAQASYRIVVADETLDVRLRAVAAADGRHLVVSVTDVTAQLAHEAEEAEARRRSMIYGQIARSLASEYATIYYVDVYTKGYIEFAASDVYRDLGVPTSGDDFFAESRENVRGLVHPDDLEALVSVMDRDVMTRKINEEGSLTITYRLNIGGRLSYTRMHAVWALDKRHLIIGVADVDEEVRLNEERRELEERNRIYGYIAQSLANQYATIYYVDVYEESYVEFASSDIYKQLEVPPAGDNFFANSRENVKRVVHPDDREAIVRVFDRDTITGLINEHGSVSITYRLMMDGKPVYTNLRAVWADDMRHLIIGVSDVDAQMRKELAQKQAEEQSLTYAHIARSLADRYDSIYYVDTLTNAYTEYASTAEYKDLNVKAEGDDFFAESAKSIRELVYGEDRDFALAAVNRENLLAALASDKVFSTNYRLMFGDVPTYINLRAVWAEDKRHLIVGVANVDEEVRREHEHAENLRAAHARALRDDLTGIRNQNAYAELESQLAREMAEGNAGPFAIVACDVNGLKDVNDTQGHKAGDDYIRAACKLICDTYAHSPVFRTGGDEFVVVLRGSDYQNRDSLLDSIRATVLANQDAGGVIVACGMSACKPGEDAKPADVFARADALMYENKKTLKGARL